MLEPPLRSTVDLTLDAATAFGLRAEVHPAVPRGGSAAVRPLSTTDFLVVLNAATDRRLLGLLRLAMGASVIASTPTQRRLVDEAVSHQVNAQRLLDDVAAETLQMLEAEGCEVRLLKGAAHAQLDYFDPAARHYIDVDLLVRGVDLDRVCALLSRAGHARRGFPQRVPGFEGRFGKGASFVTRTGAGIDVHRTLARPPFGLTVVEQDLFALPAPVSVGSTTVLAMSAPARFLHACLHAGVGDYVPRVVPLRDVLEMVASPGLDVARVMAMAAEWRVMGVVQRSMRAALARMPGSRLPAWADAITSYQLSPWEDRAMAHALTHAPPGRELLPAIWMATPRRRDRARLIAALVLPSRTFLAGRYDGYVSYWTSHLSRRLTANEQSVVPRELPGTL